MSSALALIMSVRLATILEKRSLSQSKLDEIKIKYNILRAFVEQKVEDATEKASAESFVRAEAEL
jgi:protein disulfide-isomerase A6